MNQEQIVYNNKLTAVHGISYAKGMGEVTLLENAPTKGADAKEAKKGSEKGKKVPNQKTAENNATILAKQNQAERAWKAHYAKQGKRIEDLGYAERQTIRQAVQEGWAPAPHESVAKIDTNTLPSKLPPEVRQVITTANELLDLIPADAHAQQMATLEQSLLKLSTLDISEEMREEVRGLLRNAVVAIYENGNADEPSDKIIASRVKPAVHEVLGNSLLSDENRLIKAEEVLREKNLLQEPLSEEQKAAILEAHYIGQGELGKDSTMTAGVYNYTREQLRLKAEILDNAGFNKLQRRALIEAGIAAETITPPGTPIPAELQNIIDEVNTRAAQLNSLDPLSKHDPRWLQNQIELINDLYFRGVIPNTPANAGAVVQVRAQIEEILRPLTGEKLGWQLMESDREMLRGGEFKVGEWVGIQFNQAYILAEKGQEASSPQIQYLQSRLNEANTVITDYYNQPGSRRSDLGTYLSKTIFDTFNTRLNVLYLKTIIERRDDKQIVGQAITTGAEGVAKAMNLDDGKVLMFFNEMCGLLEDFRLRDGGLEHHITPKMMEKMLNQVKEDQYKLAQLGMGSYADDYDRVRTAVDGYIAERRAKGVITTSKQRENEIHELTKAQMIRSERPALDLLVVLQQLSLINARGDFQINADLRQTVPGGGLPFNMLKYKVGSGQKLSAEGEAILNEWLINLADRYIIDKAEKKKMKSNPNKFHRLYRLDLGKKLFGKAYEPADFFSSGWRMNTLKTQLGEYFVYKYALQSIRVKKEIFHENGRVIGIDPHETRPATEQDVKDRKVTPLQVEEARQRIRNDTEGELKIAKERAEDFALFVRLQTSGATADNHNIENNLKKGDPGFITEEAQVKTEWAKITKYRPEEIMRLFRDRAAGENAFMNVFNSEPFLSNIPMGAFRPNTKLEGRVSEEQQKAMYCYDKFKEKYGLIIRTIRNKAYQEEIPRQVDFTNLNDAEQELVNRYLGAGEAGKLMDMYKAMQDAIIPKKLDERGRVVADEAADLKISSWLDPDTSHTHKTMIDALMDDARFVDIYEHTLNVDDTLMGKLEIVEYDFSGMVAISKVWSNERGADALTRNFQDIADANIAQQAILKFLDEPDFKERMKGLKEAAMAVYDMNGPDTRVEMYMAGLTTILLLAKKYPILDILNFTKLWFQIPSSKLEKLIGPHGTPLGSGELLAIINEFQNSLTKHLVEERPEDKFLAPEVREHYIKERVHKAEESVKKLKKLVGVDVWRIVKKRGISLVAFILMALLAEGFSTGLKSINEKG